ncbi:MAG: exosortase-associated EpsI family protein [bacterium]
METSANVIKQDNDTAVPFWRGILLVSIASITVVACIWGSPPPKKSEPGVVMNLPETLVGLWGSDQPVSESEKVILPADTEFAKKFYSDGLGRDIHCQIVLAGAEKRSIHRPEVCLPAQGWTIKSAEVLPVQRNDGSVLRVMKLTIAKPVTLRNGAQRELTSIFCYWFIGKHTTTPHHFVRVFKTSVDMLLHNVNHRWAYVIVNAPVLEGLTPGGKNLEETTAMVKTAIAELAPQIMPGN